MATLDVKTSPFTPHLEEKALPFSKNMEADGKKRRRERERERGRFVSWRERGGTQGLHQKTIAKGVVYLDGENL